MVSTEMCSMSAVPQYKNCARKSTTKNAAIRNQCTVASITCTTKMKMEQEQVLPSGVSKLSETISSSGDIGETILQDTCKLDTLFANGKLNGIVDNKIYTKHSPSNTVKLENEVPNDATEEHNPHPTSQKRNGHLESEEEFEKAQLGESDGEGMEVDVSEEEARLLLEDDTPENSSFENNKFEDDDSCITDEKGLIKDSYEHSVEYQTEVIDRGETLRNDSEVSLKDTIETHESQKSLQDDLLSESSDNSKSEADLPLSGSEGTFKYQCKKNDETYENKALSYEKDLHLSSSKEDSIFTLSAESSSKQQNKAKHNQYSSRDELVAADILDGMTKEVEAEIGCQTISATEKPAGEILLKEKQKKKLSPLKEERGPDDAEFPECAGEAKLPDLESNSNEKKPKPLMVDVCVSTPGIDDDDPILISDSEEEDSADSSVNNSQSKYVSGIPDKYPQCSAADSYQSLSDTDGKRKILSHDQMPPLKKFRKVKSESENTYTELVTMKSEVGMTSVSPINSNNEAKKTRSSTGVKKPSTPDLVPDICLLNAGDKVTSKVYL